MNIGRLLRIVAALALLIGGLVHLQLYFEGYRSIDKIGPSFLLNAVASGVVAAALVARKEWFVRLAGIGVAAGTIGAFIISRQGDGLFDFREQGLNPSPQAIIALVVEIVAIVTLAASFLPSVADETSPAPIAVAGVAAAVSAVALVGLGAYWSNHYDSTAKGVDDTAVDANAIQNGVQIADFAFAPQSLTVSKGSTVTWINVDPADHSVVAADVSFFSENLGQGVRFEHTFDNAGEFPYVCGIHARMTGTITVTD
jgi:plastocyanin